MFDNSSKLFQLRPVALAVIGVWACCSIQAQEVEPQKYKDLSLIQQVEITAKAVNETNSTKSRAPLRDIPMSISIVPIEILQDQAALSLDSAIKNVSGLSQSSTNNYGYFNNYLARGLPVNFLRDGLPDGPAINGYARTLTDVQQIEVLKGPGSALFGSGAPGGFINLISKKPEAIKTNTVEISAGSFQSRHIKFDVTGPMHSSANYRFIAAKTKTDGYRGFGNKTIEILPSFNFQINRDHNLNLDIRHFDSTIYNDSVGLPFRNRQLIDVPRETRFYTPFSIGKNKIARINLVDDVRLDEHWRMRGSISYGKRDLEFLRNVPNWRLSESVAGTAMVNRNWRDQQDNLTDAAAQVDASWRGHFAGSEHEVTMGLAWDQTQGSVRRKQALLAPIANIDQPVLPELSNASIDEVLMWKRDIKTAQTGIYLQDQVALSTQLKLRAGIRFSHYVIDDNGDYNTLFDAGGAFKSSLSANAQSFQSKTPIIKRELANNTTQETDPSLGFVYQPSENMSYYVGASTGSFSNFNSEMGRTAFIPETSRQIEIGNKASFWDGQLSTNVALYQTQRNDFFRTANGLSGTQGSSASKGIDVEVTARPLHGLLMRLAYAYQNTKYTQYVDVISQKNDLNVVGKHVSGVSPNQANLWTSYDFQSSGLNGLGIAAGVNFLGDFYADPANTNRSSNAPVLELALYYRLAKYELQANIGNLTNANWYRYAPGENALIPGDARSVNMTARFKF